MDLQIGMVEACHANAAGYQQNAGTTAQTGFTEADYATHTAIRARLAAINAAYYTATRLNSLTQNDCLYAIRLNDSPATIYGK